MHWNFVSQSKMGTLWVVSTPIGNLQDLSYRAHRVLNNVVKIAAEDTRHSARLLSHYDIKTPTISLHEFNEERRCEQLLSFLKAGSDIALISDAGTPLISDPGYRLVNYVRNAGGVVSCVPGPCAAIAALSISGLATDTFQFLGFTPQKSVARRQLYTQLQHYDGTLVFYESCHRVVSSLADMIAVLGAGRYAVICRELTKTFETVLTGTLDALLRQITEDSNQQKGEFVIGVATSEQASQSQTLREGLDIMRVLSEELPTSQAAKLAARLSGADRRELYREFNQA